MQLFGQPHTPYIATDTQKEIALSLNPERREIITPNPQIRIVAHTHRFFYFTHTNTFLCPLNRSDPRYLQLTYGYESNRGVPYKC